MSCLRTVLGYRHRKALKKKKKKKKEEEEEKGGGCVVYMCDKMQNGGFDKGDSNNNSTRSRGMHYLVCIKRI